MGIEINDVVFVNLNSLIVKGKVIEIIGEKFILELEDKSKCVVVKEQLINK